METTLTSTIKNISPILYDLTVIPLPEDPVEPLKEADLITSISTDNYTPQINDTIKIIINVGNNGPNNASNVKVTYKLPFGMEYLSSNGNYDPITGLWTIGNLDSGSSASLEILAKILNTGNLVNIETVTGLEYDPISANNQAKLTLNIPYLDPENQIPEVPSNLPDNGTATLPPIPNIENLIDLDIHQPGPNPIPPNNPPNPPGPNPPTPPDEPGPNPPGPDTPDPNPPTSPAPNPPTEPQKPSTQLGRDIAGVRQAVADGSSVIPPWSPDKPKDNSQVKSQDYLVYVVIGALIAIVTIAYAATKSPRIAYILRKLTEFLTKPPTTMEKLIAVLEDLFSIKELIYNPADPVGSAINVVTLVVSALGLLGFLPDWRVFALISAIFLAYSAIKIVQDYFG